MATNASCIVAASCSSSGLSLVAVTAEDVSEGAAAPCVGGTAFLSEEGAARAWWFQSAD